MNPLKPNNVLEDDNVKARLQAIVDNLADGGINYLQRTDQLYGRVPHQLKDELEQVGWLAACEWCADKDDGVVYRVCQIKRGTERSDSIIGELYRHILKRMNSFLFKDRSDRWIELRQEETGQHMADKIERGQR